MGRLTKFELPHAARVLQHVENLWVAVRIRLVFCQEFARHQRHIVTDASSELDRFLPIVQVETKVQFVRLGDAARE